MSGPTTTMMNSPGFAVARPTRTNTLPCAWTLGGLSAGETSTKNAFSGSVDANAP